MKVKIVFKDKGILVLDDVGSVEEAGRKAQLLFPDVPYRLSALEQEIAGKLSKEDILVNALQVLCKMEDEIDTNEGITKETVIELRSAFLDITNVMSKEVYESGTYESDAGKMRPDEWYLRELRKRAGALADSEDVEALEKLYSQILALIMEDDEAPECAAKSLLEAYANNDAEGMLLALTGYSMSSILDM